MKQITIAIIILCLSWSKATAQDPIFYQTDRVLTYLNPAFIGSGKSFVYESNFRSQWGSLEDGGYQTLINSAQQYLGKAGNVGINYVRDIQGELLRKNELNLGYSYKIPTGEASNLAIGVQGAYWFNSIDPNKLTFGDAIDPSIGFTQGTNFDINENISGFDAHAGINFVSKVFYLSAAAKHLLQPDQSFFTSSDSPLPMLLSGQAGVKVVYKDFQFIAHAEYYDQGSFSTLVSGLKIKWKKLQLDGGYQNNSAWFLGIASNFKLLTFAYNFVDYTGIATSGGKNYLAHEVRSCLNLNLFKKENKLPFEF
ncbi:MAG: PorP/SprF family type IX secretion system membrane protein [Flavobacteriales bacterium]|nr:PorP/SprF family type IX secretion system membrane protein [Flavobacteriales bacterium]MCB9198681.1 PorP/SprF family type IX secretion system membrane protein [Flavobacteriales bacterium]